MVNLIEGFLGCVAFVGLIFVVAMIFFWPARHERERLLVIFLTPEMEETLRAFGERHAAISRQGNDADLMAVREQARNFAVEFSRSVLSQVENA